MDEHPISRVAPVGGSSVRSRTPCAGADWIDLCQVHRPRTDTDIEEILSALTDLVHQGKVRYIDSSTFPASQIVEAQWVADVCPRVPSVMIIVLTHRTHGRHARQQAGFRMASQRPERPAACARP
jgi:aryl-alcohol dehydrogenase-like predicted oxidoreductase